VSERASSLPLARGSVLATWLVERREIVVWWAATRVVVIGSALVLHWLHAPRGYFGHALFDRPLGALEAWDGIWYSHIAATGYILIPSHQSDPAFFPLYALLLKIVGVTGVSTSVAGVALSTLLFLGALLAFDALGRELVGPQLARRATLLLAVFPTSYVCSMVYPESLVILAFALAGLFTVRRRWLACVAVAAVAGLARPEGALLLLPIGSYVVTRWRSFGPEERSRAVAAALAAPAAAFSFVLYLGWALHNPFAWSDAQREWARSFRLSGAWHALTHIGTHISHNAWGARDVALCAVTLVLVGTARRLGVPWGWIALGALIVLLPLGSGSFESDARFGLIALPAYWGLAWLARDRRVFVPLTIVSAALLAAATVTLPLVFP
jgi:hypothetical protein